MDAFYNEHVNELLHEKEKQNKILNYIRLIINYFALLIFNDKTRFWIHKSIKLWYQNQNQFVKIYYFKISWPQNDLILKQIQFSKSSKYLTLFSNSTFCLKKLMNIWFKQFQTTRRRYFVTHIMWLNSYFFSKHFFKTRPTVFVVYLYFYFNFIINNDCHRILNCSIRSYKIKTEGDCFTSSEQPSSVRRWLFLPFREILWKKPRL